MNDRSELTLSLVQKGRLAVESQVGRDAAQY